MRADIDDHLWLDSRCTLDEVELARSCGLTVAEIDELVDYGLLSPSAGRPGEYEFPGACVAPLRKACALGARFDLDLFVLGLLFSELSRISSLEQELHALRARLPRVHGHHEGPESWREPHGRGAA